MNPDETQWATFTIANLRPVSTKRILALVDVEVRVASFWIMGVQGRRAAGGSAIVQLPHLPRRQRPGEAGRGHAGIIAPAQASAPAALGGR
jgi:hypothetical protein